MDQSLGLRFLEEELPRIKSDLPCSPVLLQRLFGQLGAGRQTPLAAIAETIGQDQALAAKVLALANSAFYGLQAQVDSISRALAVLGLKEIRNLALAVAAQRLAQRKRPKGFDLPGYWRHNVATASAARLLARLINHPAPDVLFACGLLHDLGKLLIAAYSPSDWTAIETLARERRLDHAKAEQAHWGLEHGLVAAMALSVWNLPAEIAEPINWHHAPAAAPDFEREALVVHLADRLAHARQAGEADSPSGSRADAFAALGLEAEQVKAALDDTLREESLGQFVALLG